MLVRASIAFLAVVLAGQPLSHGQAATTTSTATNTTATSVRVVAPRPPMQARSYTIPGRTEPFEASTIFTRATGIITERRFDIGDAVNAGDILAVVDVPEIDRAVDSAQAAVDQAKARSDNAVQLADRAAGLAGTRAISQEEIDQRRANAIEAQAALRFAQAELDKLKTQKEFAIVRAPFSGLIAGRNFERGDRVRGDSATADGWLYRLVRLDQLRFVIAAPPDLALRLNKESKIKVGFTELPEVSLTAPFYRSSGVFDEATGTMRVEFILKNDDQGIPAGLTGTGTIELTFKGTSFIIPSNTILTENGVTMVAVINDSAVNRVPVTIGRILGRDVEISAAAISATSQVIINPNALLRDGDKVQIEAPPQPAPAK
jgi:RND family efflux transporter MFP subunit